MGSKLVAHLTRCAAKDLSVQLGEDTLSLLRKVDETAVVPTGLAELTVHLYGEAGVLKSAALRSLIFNTLSHEEGEHLCSLLEVATYAPATTLSNVPFDHPLNASILRRYFNVPTDDELLVSEATHNAVVAHQLRPQQAAAYRKLRRLIGAPKATALVHMPFGAGKLRTVATAVLDLYRSEPDGRIVLWLTSGEASCEDVFDELSAVWLQLGSRNVTAFRLYGPHAVPDLNNLQNGIIVADARKIAPDDPGLVSLGRKARVVVVGDAEGLRYEKITDLIDALATEGEFSLVGISASPGRIVNALGAIGQFSDRFAGNCVSIEEAAPLEGLNKAGDIDPINVHMEDVPSSPEFEHKHSSEEIGDDALLALSRDVDRNHAIIELVTKKAQSIEASIVLFCISAAQARLFAGLLRLRGTRASAITSEMSKSERKIELQRYQSRSDKVLCVHGLFVSGHEFPGASLAIVATPSTSSAYLNELVGRLASGRNRPQEALQVIFLADNVHDYLTIAGGIGSWDELNI